MNVTEILSTGFDGLAELRRPLMLISLRGWFDAAGAASDALDALVADRVAPVVASIDPDPFFDFTQERPQVEFDDDGTRRIIWPDNEFRLVRRAGEHHDVVVLSGVEPHLRLVTFAQAIITVARALQCEAVVTVGAAADATPHTRTPAVVGSSTNPQLASALGLSRPQYQGITGLVGVLQQRLDEEAIPAISLRVGVPHYLGNAKHPRSSAALLTQIGRILGTVLHTGDLHEEADRWRTLHDEAVAEDPQAVNYVAMLERQHDHQVEADLSTADDIAAQFEQFLRDQGSSPDAPEEDPDR